ncbi:cytochrome c biogenesis protein CcdA [bacterium]|nr:cytochrome c biogenesis protein CcdA [bacterium]MCB2179030.1 cytochrome c biogenesis protein CcdA [bacterium]
MSNINLGIAFFAGVASFLSPCVFALVPAYIGYLSGRSVAAGGDQKRANSLVTLSHGVVFVLGFSFVFVVLGALAGALGGVRYQITDILVKVGGVVVVLFGLHMTRILRIPFLDYDLRPQSQPDRNRGYISSALMGVFFSAGWAPCVGPVLGAILTLSFNSGGSAQGALMLAAYSAGLAIPFLLAATQIGWVTTIIRRYGKVMHYTEIVMGVILIAIGVLLFFGRFSQLATLGNFIEAVDEVVIGRMLVAGFLVALLGGLIPALIARSKGKEFMDWWFLGTGIIIIVLIALYTLGVFNPLLPLFSGGV